MSSLRPIRKDFTVEGYETTADSMNARSREYYDQVIRGQFELYESKNKGVIDKESYRHLKFQLIQLLEFMSKGHEIFDTDVDYDKEFNPEGYKDLKGRVLIRTPYGAPCPFLVFQLADKSVVFDIVSMLQVVTQGETNGETPDP